MTPTNTQLARALQCPEPLAAQWGDYLRAAMAHYKIDTRQRVALFLANLGHESNGLTVLSENLNYRAEALLAKFSRERISERDAYRFGRTADHPADREAIANCIYGGEWGRENLGNTQPDDGYKFRGQGPIQNTGRANAAGMRDKLRVALGVRVPDFEQSPELLTEPEWGAWSAAAFWDSRRLNDYADRNDIEGATRKINGGLNGLDDRRARYAVALAVLP